MRGRADVVEETPRPLNAKDRRVIAWTLILIVLCGSALWQLVGRATVKDAAPPSWLVSVPAGATIVGEPLIDRESSRATTYLTLRPADGATAQDLLVEMGQSEQPAQIGPSPLDWRPVWVYGKAVQDSVQIRLVYLQDRALVLSRDDAVPLTI